MGIRRALRYLRARAFTRSRSYRHRRAQLDGRAFLVLLYHRVLPHSEAQRRRVDPAMYVTPETFAAHLDWLGTDYSVLPLGAAVEQAKAGVALPKSACAITFDDGWRDNYQYAFPLLRQRGLPATVFVVSDRIGTEGAFWPDEAYRRWLALDTAARRRLSASLPDFARGRSAAGLIEGLKAAGAERREQFLSLLRAATPGVDPMDRELLDWKEIDEMSAHGIDLESHGRSHAILTEASPERLVAELRGSLETLAAHGLARQRLFAYPNGDHDARVIQAVHDAGYEAAVTTQPGLAATDCDFMRLPRASLHEHVSRTKSEFEHSVTRYISDSPARPRTR